MTATALLGHFVQQLRLHHLVQCISCVHFGTPCSEFAFEGDAHAGTTFASDGQGNHHAAAWSALGLVAFEFDHESGPVDVPGVEEEGAEALLRAIPAVLRELGQAAFAKANREATSYRWLMPSGDGSTLSHSGRALRRYAADTPQALREWATNNSINEAQAQLALELASRSAQGPCRLTDDNLAIVLTPPEDDVPLEDENVELAKRAFRSAQVEWP